MTNEHVCSVENYPLQNLVAGQLSLGQDPLGGVKECNVDLSPTDP